MKTVTRAAVSALLHKAVDDLNAQLPKAKRLSKTDDTPLIGSASVLDSLLLMNLIVVVEEKVQDELGIELSLADEAAGAPDTTPLRTLGALGDFILARALEGAPT